MSSRFRAAGFPVAHRNITLIAICALLAVLAAHGSDSVAGPRKLPTSTTPVPDPFQSYIVPVSSLRLVDSTGKTVEVVSTPVLIDFAQIIDLDLAVNAGLVPPGDYTAATLVLDFSKAEITALGSTAGVKLQPYDSYGNPITDTRTVKMGLDGYRHFVVSAKTAALLALDPRLLASNTIDAANGIVTVGDQWAATVVPSGNQWVRLTGNLTVVNATDSAYVLTVGGRKAYNTVATGDIKLVVSPTTNYTIAGQAYVGTGGEVVLATYPKGTSITATGSLQPDRKTLMASIVVVN